MNIEVNAEIQAKILKWIMTSSDVGSSSKAMAAAATGRPSRNLDHPHDPSDLNRCLKLCKEVPEVKANFNKVAELSGTWKKLIGRWDELEKCFIDEVGYDWCNARSAPKTYSLIKEIIN